MKKGFSLVELSIVLVIIGVIMGLAIKGKSLIEAAKVKSDISRIRAMEITWHTYEANNDEPPAFDSNGNLVDDSFIPADIVTMKAVSNYDLTFRKLHFIAYPALPDGYFELPTPVTANHVTVITLKKLDSVADFPSAKVVCLLERQMDDKDTLSGDMRVIRNTERPPASEYVDCNLYGQKKANKGYAIMFGFEPLR